MILPVALDVENRPVLIVGGGGVAARKAAAFLEAGAIVTVISPQLAPDFPRVEHRAKRYESGDLSGFSLVCACTDNREVNAQVATDAQLQRVWCNVADAPQNSDFHTAAVVRRGAIAIGISTGAISPVLSRHLRAQIEAAIGAEYAQLLKIVGDFEVPLSKRGAFWRGVLSSEALNHLRSNERLLATEVLKLVFKSVVEKQEVEKAG